MIRRSVATVLIAASSPACVSGGQEASGLSELGDMTAKPAEIKTEIAHAAVDDSSYRRAYGTGDVNVHECATVQTDGTIVGENCPSAFVVFGPYVFAPGNSDVSVTFELEAANKLSVASDIVSSAAKNVHAALGDQELSAGERRRFSYRAHFFQSAEGVESRLWIRGDDPTRFKLTQLVLDVR